MSNNSDSITPENCAEAIQSITADVQATAAMATKQLNEQALLAAMRFGYEKACEDHGISSKNGAGLEK